MDDEIQGLSTAINEAFNQNEPSQEARESIQYILQTDPLHFIELITSIINNPTNSSNLISLALLLSDNILKWNLESEIFSYNFLMNFINTLFSFFSHHDESIRNSAIKSCTNFYLYLYSNIISESYISQNDDDNNNYNSQVNDSQKLFLDLFQLTSDPIESEAALKCFEYISNDMYFSPESTISFFDSLSILLFSPETSLKIKNICVQIIEHFNIYFSDIITPEFMVQFNELLVQTREVTFYQSSFQLLASLILIPESIPIFDTFYPFCIEYISSIDKFDLLSIPLAFWTILFYQSSETEETNTYALTLIENLELIPFFLNLLAQIINYEAKYGFQSDEWPPKVKTIALLFSINICFPSLFEYFNQFHHENIENSDIGLRTTAFYCYYFILKSDPSKLESYADNFFNVIDAALNDSYSEIVGVCWLIFSCIKDTSFYDLLEIETLNTFFDNMLSAFQNSEQYLGELNEAFEALIWIATKQETPNFIISMIDKLMEIFLSIDFHNNYLISLLFDEISKLSCGLFEMEKIKSDTETFSTLLSYWNEYYGKILNFLETSILPNLEENIDTDIIPAFCNFIKDISRINKGGILLKDNIEFIMNFLIQVLDCSTDQSFYVLLCLSSIIPILDENHKFFLDRIYSLLIDHFNDSATDQYIQVYIMCFASFFSNSFILSLSQDFPYDTTPILNSIFQINETAKSTQVTKNLIGLLHYLFITPDKILSFIPQIISFLLEIVPTLNELWDKDEEDALLLLKYVLYINIDLLKLNSSTYQEISQECQYLLEFLTELKEQDTSQFPDQLFDDFLKELGQIPH